MTDSQNTQTILVVDDVPENIDIISGVLQGKYRIKAALNGPVSLKIARSESPPDLILLDIQMADMDGYEVCKTLKSDPKTRKIPVIFLTGKTETDDETRGLELGAVDYITKPINPPILLTRINTHLNISNQKKELEKSYQTIKMAEESRDTLAHMIVHDLNNPLANILGFSQLAERVLQKETLDRERVMKHIKGIQSSANQMRVLIRGILDISKLEAGDMPVNLAILDGVKLAREASAQFASSSEGEPLIKFESSLEQALLKADEELLMRVLQNLIGNALKHTARGTSITCSVHRTEEEIIFSVSDQGPGIPEEYTDKIFDKFFQIQSRTEGKKYGVGLGLAFCKMAITAQGGRIWVESKEGDGSVFKVALPGV